MRAITSRGSKGIRRSGGTTLMSSSGSDSGSMTVRGRGPCLTQLSLATIRRPIRMASRSSTAKWSAKPDVRACISAPPSDSSSDSSPVAIFTSGGPARRPDRSDHHDVTGHAGYVRAACRRISEHQGDCRDARGRQAGQIAEHLSARDEDLLLRGKVGSARFHQRDHRQPVLEGDLIATQDLLERPWIAGAALDGWVVGHQQALDALDHTDARHQVAPT